MARDRPHFPGQVTVDAYGNGGFRFAEMSHRGSLLCLPSGIWAWDAPAAAGIDIAALQPVFAEADAIDILVIGAGAAPAVLSPALRAALREHGIGVEALSTGAAVRTYNILLAERRRVAAALIAVD